MILLKDPKTDFFNVSSSFNLSKEELPSKIIRITKGVLKDINETKKSLIIDNPEEYPLLKFSKKNILISPLINQNELVGVILLADKESRAGLERFIPTFCFRYSAHVTRAHNARNCSQHHL